MDAKTAIEWLQDESIKRWMKTPKREALALALRALEVCDELGLLEETLPGPNPKLAAAMSLLSRETEYDPWTDEGMENLIRELYAAYRFLKKNSKQEEGK